MRKRSFWQHQVTAEFNPILTWNENADLCAGPRTRKFTASSPQNEASVSEKIGMAGREFSTLILAALLLLPGTLA
jgi:hypothetical protein